MSTEDLKALGADTLRRLGGLRDTCTARLTCVAHGLGLPCEQCHVEGLSAIACQVCGGRTDAQTLVVTGGEHACASVAQFMATGRIAFEDEARAALQRLENERAEREARRRKYRRVLGSTLVTVAVGVLLAVVFTRGARLVPAGTPLGQPLGDTELVLVDDVGFGYSGRRDAVQRAVRSVVKRLAAEGRVAGESEDMAPADMNQFVTSFELRDTPNGTMAASVGVSVVRLDQELKRREASRREKTSLDDALSKAEAPDPRARGALFRSLFLHFPVGAFQASGKVVEPAVGSGAVKFEMELNLDHDFVEVMFDGLKTSLWGRLRINTTGRPLVPEHPDGLLVCDGPVSCYDVASADWKGESSGPSDLIVTAVPHILVRDSMGRLAIHPDPSTDATPTDPDPARVVFVRRAGSGGIGRRTSLRAAFRPSVTASVSVPVAVLREPDGRARSIRPVALPIGFSVLDAKERKVTTRAIGSVASLEPFRLIPLTDLARDQKFLRELWLSARPFE